MNLDDIKATVAQLEYGGRYKDRCEPDSAFTTNGVMLIRREALPPKQWALLKKLRQDRLDVPDSVIREYMRRKKMGKREVVFSGIETWSWPTSGRRTPKYLAILQGKNGRPVYANAVCLKWMLRFVDFTRLLCESRLEPIWFVKGNKRQAALQPVWHPSHTEL